MCKITFVTTTYNGEKFIKQCIESVLSQTLDDFEYYIIDNNSTDGTRNIIKDYAKKDKRIKYFLCSENRAFRTYEFRKQYKGKYFVSLDQDDWYDCVFAEKMYKLAEENAIDIALCGSELLFTDDDTKGYRCPTSKMILENDSIGSNFSYLYQFLRTVWGKLIKTSLLQNTEFLEKDIEPYIKGRYAGDTFLILSLLDEANKIGLLNEVHHFYRVHKASGSHNFNEYRFLTDLAIYEKAINLLVSKKWLSNFNFAFIGIVFINAIIDTIQVTLSSNISNVRKIDAISSIICNELSKDWFLIEGINEKEIIIDLVLKFLDSCLISDIELKSTEISMIWLALNKRLEILNDKSLLMLFKHDRNLFTKIMRSTDDDNIFFLILNNVSNDSIEAVWSYIYHKLKQNVLTKNLTDRIFVCRFKAIIWLAYKSEYKEAINKIMQHIEEDDLVDIEISLLILLNNLAAQDNNAEIYVLSFELLFQVYYHRGEIENAIDCIENLLDIYPDTAKYQDMYTHCKYLV